MNSNSDKLFIEELESHRNVTDIMQSVWFLRSKVRNQFPMNKIPDSIITEMQILYEKFICADAQLNLALDVIIEEVKRLDGLKGE